jgi:hypothetical protein
MDVDGELAFVTLAGRACPPIHESLTTVAAAFHAVDRPAVDARLDDLARPLFEAGTDPAAGMLRLAALLGGPEGFAVEAFTPEALWLDEVLLRHRGHPLLLAAVGAEAARRAGWDAGVYSARGIAYAGIEADGRVWLVDPAGATPDAPREAELRRHCGHELCHGILTALAERFRQDGEHAGLRRARALRLLLAEATRAARP